LEFRQAKVPDVLAELSRAYGVEIRVADPALKARKITFSVRVNQQSLQSVLDALAATLDAHVGHSDGVITLLPGAATTSKLKHVPPHSTLESQYGR
jgi:ferric-dicitrate binding protein FerR (iron transport regulator)